MDRDIRANACETNPNYSATDPGCCKIAHELLAREVARELAYTYGRRAEEFGRLADSLGELPRLADAALRRTLESHLRSLLQL